MCKFFKLFLFAFILTSCSQSGGQQGNPLEGIVAITSIVGAGVSASNGDYNRASQILDVGRKSLETMEKSRLENERREADQRNGINSSSSGGSVSGNKLASNNAVDSSGGDITNSYGSSDTKALPSDASRKNSLNSTDSGFRSTGNCTKDKTALESWMKRWNIEGQRLNGLCDKHKHIVNATQRQRAFLNQCSVYDPTGRGAAALLETENGAKDGIRAFCS